MRLWGCMVVTLGEQTEMAISKQLFLSILALDAYNQGYEVGLRHGATKIGSATVFDDKGDAQAQSLGFYAVAYDDPSYGKIISYRGTDNDLSV